MSKPWLKVWTEKVKASVNYRLLTQSQKGTWWDCLMEARTDGPFKGCLVFASTGKPYSIDDIAVALGKDVRTIRRHIDSLLARGMLNVVDNVDGVPMIKVRNVIELQELGKIPVKSPGNPREIPGKTRGEYNDTNDLGPTLYTEGEGEVEGELKQKPSGLWINQPLVENLEAVWNVKFQVNEMSHFLKDYGLGLVAQEALKQAAAAPSKPTGKPMAYLHGIAKKIQQRGIQKNRNVSKSTYRR